MMIWWPAVVVLAAVHFLAGCAVGELLRAPSRLRWLAYDRPRMRRRKDSSSQDLENTVEALQACRANMLAAMKIFVGHSSTGAKPVAEVCRALENALQSARRTEELLRAAAARFGELPSPKPTPAANSSPAEQLHSAEESPLKYLHPDMVDLPARLKQLPPGASEQRSDQRYPATLPVIIRPLNERLESTDEYYATTSDISRKGVGLIQTHPTSAKFLDIEIQTGPGELLRLLVEVMHQRQVGGLTAIGCKFVKRIEGQD